MGVGGIKENGGKVNSNIFLIHCKNLLKCYNAPTPNTTKVI
jgi:hypothetical protein